MTEDFKDEIRERMGAVDLNLNVCEYLSRYHADTVRELWSLTEETGLEHGTAVWLEEGQPTAFSPQAGRERSIHNVTPPTGDSLGPVNISLHTHPNNSLALSEADFQSLSGKLQLPPERVDWVGGETVRGIAIISRRLKEKEISIRGWTGSVEHTRLTIEEQSDRYPEIISRIREADALRRGVAAEREFGDLATACMEQVEP